MGTYTTNYNLFMPSIGEQGWGELVNENFTTIDTTMSGLNTRVGTLETETDAVEERVDTLETDVTNIKTKIGTGTYVTGVSIPIIAKLTTNNEGYGWVISDNEYNYPIGMSFINGDETQSATVHVVCYSSTKDVVYTVYGVNILTGVSRTITSFTARGNNVSRSQVVDGIRYNETISVSVDSSGSFKGVTRAKVYIGIPD